MDRRQGFFCQVYSELGEHEDFKPQVLRVGTAWKKSVDLIDSSEIKEKQESGLSGVPFRHVVYDHMEVVT